jgi:acetolactate synthase-1/2/3 large subunit
MNGADAILKTLADNGVEVCFANPGTSEMQMVSAFDREPRVRAVLCLFEGVATGAADGYTRIAKKLAATLLHLGAGLANGSASLHNARRARSPIINIVGDHATYHRGLDAPLTSDIAGLARLNSIWVETAETPDEAAIFTTKAIVASQTGGGGPATLILPADCAWLEASNAGPIANQPSPVPPEAAWIAHIADLVRSARTPVLLLGSGALTERGLEAAGQIALTGVRVLIDTFVARQPRGAGRYAPGRMQYFAEMAIKDLLGTDLMILASTKAPVAFFAYPATPSLLAPDGCEVETLAKPDEDAVFALEALAEVLGAPALPVGTGLVVDQVCPTGPLNAAAIGGSITRHMPSEAIISDDGVTSSAPIYAQTVGARPHDWLFLTGGAIGQGIPVAIGAAIAAPGRKVICLTGDGAASFTVQGLWTLAREKLDVVVVVFANHAYRVLTNELARTHSLGGGKNAHQMLSIDDPRIDWVSIANGFGLSAVRCESAESFDAAFSRSMAEPGPTLIEASID